jgi:hypothetical protein
MQELNFPDRIENVTSVTPKKFRQWIISLAEMNPDRTNPKNPAMDGCAYRYNPNADHPEETAPTCLIGSFLIHHGFEYNSSWEGLSAGKLLRKFEFPYGVEVLANLLQTEADVGTPPWGEVAARIKKFPHLREDVLS